MRRLTENVIQLGNRHFNYFIVGQKTAAVVECGVSAGVLSFRKQWEQWQGKPDIQYLMAMHAHFDHVCGIPALRQIFPEAMVLGSKEGQKVLNNQKILEDFFFQDLCMSERLMREGIIAPGFQAFSEEKIILDRIIGEGDEIEFAGGLNLKIIDAPGHSPCSLAAYLPADQVMFLSDAAGFQISDEDIFPVFFQGYEVFIETIKRLMGFPTRLLGIPHERIWSNQEEIQAFYKRALSSARQAFDSIHSMLDQGMDEEDIKAALFSRYYQGYLRIYTPANIKICVNILLRRVKECL